MLYTISADNTVPWRHQPPAVTMLKEVRVLNARHHSGVK